MKSNTQTQTILIIKNNNTEISITGRQTVQKEKNTQKLYNIHFIVGMLFSAVFSVMILRISPIIFMLIGLILLVIVVIVNIVNFLRNS